MAPALGAASSAAGGGGRRGSHAALSLARHIPLALAALIGAATARLLAGVGPHPASTAYGGGVAGGRVTSSPSSSLLGLPDRTLWQPFVLAGGGDITTGGQHLRAGAAAAAPGALRRDLYVPAFCGNAAMRPPPEDAELGAAFDCICHPQVVRPRHCRYLLLQSGDYHLERPYAALDEMPYFTASRVAVQLYAAAHGHSYLYVDLRGRRAGLDRAPAWMKLPLVRLLGEYFDAVLSLDPDTAPGRNFTRDVAALGDLVPPGSGRVAVFAGNAPSPPGGPCTGVMMFRTCAPGTGAPLNDTRRLLQHWWTAPDRLPDEFGAYKTKHVWEQQVIDRLVRRRAEFAGNLSMVLPPAVMGNPDSPWWTHTWSDPATPPNERHRRLQAGVLNALAQGLVACGGEPRCVATLTRVASWRHYLPVVSWGDLYPGRDLASHTFWFGSATEAVASAAGAPHR